MWNIQGCEVSVICCLEPFDVSSQLSFDRWSLAAYIIRRLHFTTSNVSGFCSPFDTFFRQLHKVPVLARLVVDCEIFEEGHTIPAHRPQQSNIARLFSNLPIPWLPTQINQSCTTSCIAVAGNSLGYQFFRRL